jgi:uncharacterized protein (TIGR03663 family)
VTTATSSVAQNIEPAPETTQAEALPLAWLTLETLLYGVVLALAVALRLWGLGRIPLTDPEAAQALAALTLYRGNFPTAELYSPLLVTLNLLAFLLLEPAETAVRLAVALGGSALVLSPLLLRRQLGPKTTLLAAALLAFSPTALFFSRSLNGELFVVLGALLLVAGFFNWAAQGRQGWLYSAMAGLAMMLTSGPMSFSLLVIFGVIIAIRWRAFAALWQQGLGHTAVVPDDENRPALHPQLRNSLIFLVVALLLLGTAGMLNLAGMGMTSSLLADWLNRFSFQSRPDAAYNGVFLLAMYEPLLVVAGLVGLAFALRSGSLLKQSLAGWFLGALLLDLVMAGRPPGTLLLSLVPLMLLGASALAELWESLESEGAWANEGVIVAAGLVILSFGYIGLTGWLERPCAEGDNICQLAWLQSVAALALFVVIVLFFWFVNGAGVALRGLALTGVSVGLLVMVSTAWRLNYGPIVRLPYQPLVTAPVSNDLVRLHNTLASESLLRTGDQNMLEVAVVGIDSPALWWQLRNFENATQVSSPLEITGSPAIITAPTENREFNLGTAFLGQDFGLNSNWSPAGLGVKDILSWVIYRELPRQPDQDKIILWLTLKQP